MIIPLGETDLWWPCDRTTARDEETSPPATVREAGRER